MPRTCSFPVVGTLEVGVDPCCNTKHNDKNIYFPMFLMYEYS